MPSDQQPASSTTIPQFDAVEERIGENPARYLDFPLYGSGSNGLLARARIRGLDTIEACRAWLAVERALDRGPRDKVVELLEERERELEDLGDRPDRLPHGPRRPPEWFDTESAVDDDSPETALDKKHRMGSATEGETA